MKNMEQLIKIDYLSNLSEGETGEIVQVRGKPEVHRYLNSQGLMLGRSVSVDGALTTPQNQFITIHAGDRVAVIDREIASNVKVQILN
jgi:Fe2+ transport system protein FeoA